MFFAPRFFAPRNRAANAFSSAWLVLAFAGAACDAGAAPPQEVGLTMLDVMIQIDHAYRAIEPNFRNPDGVEDTALAAQQILDWTADPVFEAFVRTPRFQTPDPAEFFTWRDQMQGGAQKTLDGAHAVDLDLMRQGFIEMKTSCIGCHKRYSPSY